MRTHVERFLLDILHRNGIEPTQREMDDFINRMICGWWSQIGKERMDERLIVKNAVDSAVLVLPNGRVGEQYKAPNDFAIEGVDEYEIVGLDAIGLTYEKTEKGFIIYGTAQPEDIKGGDFPLILRYKPKGLLEDEDWFERKLTLILNPDPKTLWNNIPTPRDTPYFKEDSQMQYVKVEEKKRYAT